MSQLQFQTALAMLIRLPDHNRGDIENFLSQYDLDQTEKINLMQLAKHREVSKFGFKLRGFRIEFFLQTLSLTLQIVDQEDLINFIKWEFDPYFTAIEARTVYRHFRHFFMGFKEPERKKVLKKYFDKLPDYFFDLIQFELLEGELEFHGFSYGGQLPKNSLLAHHNFETLALDFNIHEYVEKKRNLSSDQPTLLPNKIKTWLLFLRDDNNHYGYQVFEIDKSGINFLDQARLGQCAAKPSYYDDFVACGLCR